MVFISIVFKNCETNEDQKVSVDFENLQKINIKTVSFQDAKKIFDLKIEEVIRERKIYASKDDSPPLELSPDWNTLKHDELVGIDKAQLTFADVDVNREGDYISKLFFVNINDKVETVIFTIYQKKVNNDGKIIEATLYFNKLDGQFLDGYKIENGLLTKRLVVKKKPNVQKGAMFLLLQKQEVVDWNCLTGLDGGELGGISLTLSGGGSSGISPGPTSSGIGGFTGINVYSIGNSNASSSYSGGGGAGSYLNVTSVAGSLYANAVYQKSLTQEEDPDRNQQNCTNNKIYNPETKMCECPEGMKDDGRGNCLNESEIKCDRLKRLVQNDSLGSNILPIVYDLRKKLGPKDNEWFINFKNSWVNGNRKNIADPIGIQEGISKSRSEIYYGKTWVGQIHTHPKNTYSIFSWLDLRALMLSYTGVHDDFKDEIFLMVIAPNNVTFAIKVDTIKTLTVNIENDLKNAPGKNDDEKMNYVMENLEREYKKSNNLKQTFLEIFGKYGISLYESMDANLNNWKKLELNEINNKIINEIPCK